MFNMLFAIYAASMCFMMVLVIHIPETKEKFKKEMLEKKGKVITDPVFYVVMSFYAALPIVNTIYALIGLAAFSYGLYRRIKM